MYIRAGGIGMAGMAGTAMVVPVFEGEKNEILNYCLCEHYEVASCTGSS